MSAAIALDAKLGSMRNSEIDDLAQDHEQLRHLMTLKSELEHIRDHSTDPDARRRAEALLVGVVSRMDQLEHDDLDRHLGRRSITEAFFRQLRNFFAVPRR